MRMHAPGVVSGAGFRASRLCGRGAEDGTVLFGRLLSGSPSCPSVRRGSMTKRTSSTRRRSTWRRRRSCSTSAPTCASSHRCGFCREKCVLKRSAYSPLIIDSMHLPITVLLRGKSSVQTLPPVSASSQGCRDPAGVCTSRIITPLAQRHMQLGDDTDDPRHSASGGFALFPGNALRTDTAAGASLVVGIYAI